MHHRLSSPALAAAAFSLLALAGCAQRAPAAGGAAPAGPVAQAQLEPTRGNTTTGQIRFTTLADGSVRVQGQVQGLAPNQQHGFHIHEKGDCSSGDGMSAGGHFNPTGAAHGRHGQGMHHTGDLPSLQADAQGVAKIDFVSRSLQVAAGATSVVGRGLIVHKDPDDYTTQPTGNAGARLACAVIR